MLQVNNNTMLQVEKLIYFGAVFMSIGWLFKQRDRWKE